MLERYKYCPLPMVGPNISITVARYNHVEIVRIPDLEPGSIILLGLALSFCFTSSYHAVLPYLRVFV